MYSFALNGELGAQWSFVPRCNFKHNSGIQGRPSGVKIYYFKNNLERYGNTSCVESFDIQPMIYYRAKRVCQLMKIRSKFPREEKKLGICLQQGCRRWKADMQKRCTHTRLVTWKWQPPFGRLGTSLSIRKDSKLENTEKTNKNWKVCLKKEKTTY